MATITSERDRGGQIIKFSKATRSFFLGGGGLPQPLANNVLRCQWGRERHTFPFIKQPTDLSKTQGEPSTQLFSLKRGVSLLRIPFYMGVGPPLSRTISLNHILRNGEGAGVTQT